MSKKASRPNSPDISNKRRIPQGKWGCLERQAGVQQPFATVFLGQSLGPLLRLNPSSSVQLWQCWLGDIPALCSHCSSTPTPGSHHTATLPCLAFLGTQTLKVPPPHLLHLDLLTRSPWGIPFIHFPSPLHGSVSSHPAQLPRAGRGNLLPHQVTQRECIPQPVVPRSTFSDPQKGGSSIVNQSWGPQNHLAWHLPGRFQV